MPDSRYYSWVVTDVENWSSRSAVSGARIQAALRKIEQRALESLDLEATEVGRQPRGDGSILALPGGIPKERIAIRFVEALHEAVLDHATRCDPDDSIRLRLCLNSGDVLDGDGEWAGQPVILACRLVESQVIRRVLAASIGNPLALILPAQWYHAVIGEGYAPGDGYQEVWAETKTFSDFAWVRVPGRTRPAGLLPEDDPAPHKARQAHSDLADEGRATADHANYSGNRGVIVHGSTVNDGIHVGNRYYDRTAPSDRGAR